VKLQDSSDYPPYILGRLFAVLERIQQRANPNINTTIKERYLDSATTVPFAVFPTILKLAEKHLKVIKRNNPEEGLYLEKQLVQLNGRIHESYPKHLNLEEQGVFILGYYHQKQSFYEKKEKKENE
jgi:CRISPR-associated protein Csd1